MKKILDIIKEESERINIIEKNNTWNKITKENSLEKISNNDNIKEFEEDILKELESIVNWFQ